MQSPTFKIMLVNIPLSMHGDSTLKAAGEQIGRSAFTSKILFTIHYTSKPLTFIMFVHLTIK